MPLSRRWYLARRVTLDAGGYYKLDAYHYDNALDNTTENGPLGYPGYLEMQKFATYDGNARLTWRLTAARTSRPGSVLPSRRAR